MSSTEQVLSPSEMGKPIINSDADLAKYLKKYKLASIEAVMYNLSNYQTANSICVVKDKADNIITQFKLPLEVTKMLKSVKSEIQSLNAKLDVENNGLVLNISSGRLDKLSENVDKLTSKVSNFFQKKGGDVADISKYKTNELDIKYHIRDYTSTVTIPAFVDISTLIKSVTDITNLTSLSCITTIDNRKNIIITIQHSFSTDLFNTLTTTHKQIYKHAINTASEISTGTKYLDETGRKEIAEQITNVLVPKPKPAPKVSSATVTSEAPTASATSAVASEQPTVSASLPAQTGGNNKFSEITLSTMTDYALNTETEARVGGRRRKSKAKKNMLDMTVTSSDVGMTDSSISTTTHTVTSRITKL